MNEIQTRDTYWQKIRGGCILAVIFIHCKNGTELPLDTLNGCSYFIIRNLVNFPVNIFFFMSGFFVRPIDDISTYYKKRLPKLIIPYFFYSALYLIVKVLSGGTIRMRTLIGAVFLGTAATPFYYIVVLTYFTIITPFLLKTLRNKILSVLILLSTPICLVVSYALFYVGIDVLSLMKYTPVWLSFYYLGMWIKSNDKYFNRKILWILLPVSFITELISTKVLYCINGSNPYTQLRFAGAFYALIIALLIVEYSHDEHNDSSKILIRIGDDSYGIFYMHCIFTMLFTKIVPFDGNTILLLYETIELLFAVIMCEIIICVIRKFLPQNKIRMIFGV